MAPDRLLAKKQIVHFPEFPLMAGRFGGISGFLGVSMRRQRKVPIDEADVVLLLDFVERLGKPSAWRALEIAKLLERYGRILRPPRMNDFAGRLNLGFGNFQGRL